MLSELSNSTNFSNCSMMLSLDKGMCEMAPEDGSHPRPERIFSNTTVQIFSFWSLFTKSIPSLTMSGIVTAPVRHCVMLLREMPITKECQKRNDDREVHKDKNPSTKRGWNWTQQRQMPFRICKIVANCRDDKRPHCNLNTQFNTPSFRSPSHSKKVLQLMCQKSNKQPSRHPFEWQLRQPCLKVTP